MDKKIKKILEDFKDLYFINLALEKNNVRAFDFFNFLSNNLDFFEEYKKIENFNNIYNESIIAEKVYNQEYSNPILLEMIKANNKKKYDKKIILEEKNITDLTDEEIEERIKILQEKNS